MFHKVADLWPNTAVVISIIEFEILQFVEWLLLKLIPLLLMHLEAIEFDELFHNWLKR